MAINYSVIPAAFSLGQSIRGLIDGDGDNSASATTTSTPSGYDYIGPGAFNLWTDFMRNWTGQSGYVPNIPADVANEKTQLQNRLNALNKQDPDYMAQAQPILDRMREIETQYPGEIVRTPGMQEMMAEDTGAQKGAWEQYLGSTGETTNQYLDELAGNKDRLEGAEGQYMSPAFNFKLGGQDIGVIPKGNRDAVSLAQDSANIYNAMAGLGKTAQDTQAGNQLTYGTTYTPNKATMDYVDKMWPIIQAMNDWRYRTPTTSSTGTVSQSNAEKVQNVIQNTQNMTDAIQTIVDSFKKEK